MKIGKKKLLFILIPVSLICILLVDILVKKVLANNDDMLINVRSMITVVSIIMLVVTAIILIVDIVKSLKNKKASFSRLFMIIAAIAAVLCVSSFIVIKEDDRAYHSINVNWNMHLPGNYDEVYYKENVSSVLGNGIRYSVFEYDNEDKLNKAVNWTKGENVSEIEKPVTQILDELHVDLAKYPDFNSDYKYYHQNLYGTSDIYMIANDKSKKVYIIENLN